MKLSIVVPAWNEERLLPAALEAIHAAARAFEGRCDWELVVCDNNSTDRTAGIAHAAGAKVVFEPHNQIARARNAGAAAATGDWLVFVDADSTPGEGLFGELLEAIQSGKVIGGGATLAVHSPMFIVRFMIGAWNLVSRVTSWAAGAFVYCEARAFRELGGFNEELYASEELDLSRRLKRLARQRGKRFHILHRHPLLTSDRKAHLYSTREMLGYALRAALRPRAALRNAKDCTPWYDGRR